MALAIVCGESSSSCIFLLGILDGAVDSFKKKFSRVLTNLLLSKADGDVMPGYNGNENLLPCTYKDILTNVGRQCQLTSLDLISEKNQFKGERNPEAVFNVLDALLKDTLDRLKVMRDSISLAEEGFQGCILDVNYHNHIDMIRDFCLRGKFMTALSLRRKAIKKGFIPDILAHNYLLNGLCKAGYLEKADSIVGEMIEMGPFPNCATYNIIIKGYTLSNDVDKVLYIFSTMVNSGIRPNRITYNTLIYALCKKGRLGDARKLLGDILDENSKKTTADSISSTILMDGYFKSGDMAQALSLWDEVVKTNIPIDIVMYNVIIHGFCLSGYSRNAFGYVCDMVKRGLLPDIFTYNTLIGCFCKEGKFKEAFNIHKIMSRMGVTPDQLSYKMIVQGLCIYGEIVKASELLFLLVPEPHIWNVVIDACGKRGDLTNALAIRNQMVASGVPPNVFTYNALIHALVKSGDTVDAFSLKNEMVLCGIFPDLVTYNLLIGAACSLGDIRSALQLQDEMRKRGLEPDKITYTELIRGHQIRGNRKEAIDLLAKMLSRGSPMDHVPFQILFGNIEEFDPVIRIWSSRRLKAGFFSFCVLHMIHFFLCSDHSTREVIATLSGSMIPRLDPICTHQEIVNYHVISHPEEALAANSINCKEALRQSDTDVNLKLDVPKRIKKCKGRIFSVKDEPSGYRIWMPNEDCPGLAMARAFGDFYVKDYGLIRTSPKR